MTAYSTVMIIPICVLIAVRII